MALYFKVLGSIHQRAAGVAHGVGVAYVDVAAQAGDQQRIEPAINGHNMIALPRQLAQQIRTRHHRRAADH